ncbi:MAG TPA: GNAT family N-acetyltransferase [Saprospiraceae bacterium]|nr:GNAT family N-acetyltransferase [Saprospiraceae bacterium]
MRQKSSSHEIRPMIRQAVVSDLEAILQLVRELAEYEQAPGKVTATLATYQDAFTAGYFEALVADLNGEIVGTSIYFRAFSTWKGRMMYLEDFVVHEEYRRHGIGRLLFEAFLEKAQEAQSVLCKWQVLRWNEPAINFYRKYDTVFDDEWVDVKIYF